VCPRSVAQVAHGLRIGQAGPPYNEPWSVLQGSAVPFLGGSFDCEDVIGPVLSFLEPQVIAGETDSGKEHIKYRQRCHNAGCLQGGSASVKAAFKGLSHSAEDTPCRSHTAAVYCNRN
jgi:hypothetical protein